MLSLLSIINTKLTLIVTLVLAVLGAFVSFLMLRLETKEDADCDRLRLFMTGMGWTILAVILLIYIFIL